MAADDSASERSRPNLLTLPQELQDQIFEQAYTIDSPFTITTKICFDATERDRKKRDPKGYVVKHFSRHKVSDFLVSKIFFVNAAKAYIANISSDMELGRHAMKEGIGYAFATTYSQWSPSNYSRSHPANLKHLTVRLCEAHFEDLEPKYLWEDVITETEFKESVCFKHLQHVRGLKTFKFHVHCPHYAQMEEQKRIWLKNIRRLRKMLKTEVKQPKPVITQELCLGRCGQDELKVPLYAGSRVSLHGSNLLSGWNGEMYQRESMDKGSVEKAKSARREPEKAEEAQNGLRDEDVPQTVEGWQKALLTHGDQLMEWVCAAKRHRLN